MSGKDSFSLDSDAIWTARDRLNGVEQDVRSQAQRHNQLQGDIASMLYNAGSEVLDTLNPEHLLDPWGVWTRWGFDGIAGALWDSHGTVDGARGSASWAVQQVVAAHPGSIGAIIEGHSAALLPALGDALDAIANAGNVLTVGNILWLLRNPGAIWEAQRAAQSALFGAAERARELVGYLESLASREEALIAGIVAELALAAGGALAAAAPGVFAAASKVAQSDVVTFVDAVVGLVDQVHDLGGPWGTGVLFVLDTTLKVLQGGSVDPQILFREIAGNGMHLVADIAAGVPGAWAEGALLVTTLVTLGDSWGQSALGRAQGGQIGTLLQQQSSDLNAVSKTANLDKAFNDAAQLVLDSHGAVLLGPQGIAMMNVTDVATGHNPWSLDRRLASDDLTVGKDVVNTALSVPKGLVDVVASGFSDESVLTNNLIQNLPFSAQYKANSAALTAMDVQQFTGIANWVTNLSL